MSAISRKNQITIPADVLRAAGLGPGDDVRVTTLGPGRSPWSRPTRWWRSSPGRWGTTRIRLATSTGARRMAVVVFDSDVLIGFLNGADAHHADAVEVVRESLEPGTRRMINAVNYSEILIGPIKAGKAASDHVEAMLARFAIEIVEVDTTLARRAATVRARTGVSCPTHMRRHGR